MPEVLLVKAFISKETVERCQVISWHQTSRQGSNIHLDNIMKLMSQALTLHAG